jgi:hypothetical protein
MGILVPIISFIVLGYMVKVVSDNKVRRMVVEKGEISENIKYVFNDSTHFNAPASLKWGLVLLAIGLGLFVGHLLDNLGLGSEELTFALMFIAGGFAMIVYYFIASKMAKKLDQQ